MTTREPSYRMWEHGQLQVFSQLCDACNDGECTPAEFRQRTVLAVSQMTDEEVVEFMLVFKS